MTLQQLKYVVTVAECGNITEAAKQLFVSQPTVTLSLIHILADLEIKYIIKKQYNFLVFDFRFLVFGF